VKTMAAAASARPASPVQSTQPVATISEFPTSAARTVSRDEIALLAYSYWVERGYEPGSPEEDWLRAEQELAATR
jgi:hypothetical protein